MDLDKKHKIIVFGENHHNTLGLVRSLGEVALRTNLILVNSNKLCSFVAKSRYLDQAWIVDDVNSGLEILINEFNDELYKPVVFPTFDSEVKVLSEHFEKLTNKYILPNIIDRTWKLHECLSKEFMRHAADKCGLLTPKSWLLDCSGDIHLPSDVKYPCVIKAIDSTSGPKNYDVCKTEEMLLESLKSLSKYCQLIQVQTFVEKRTEVILLGWSDGKGNTVIPCLMDKIREYPKNFGTTGLGKVTKNFNEYIDIDKVYNFVNYLGYSGLFSVEFLLSGNEAYFLEINLRNDGNGYLPTYGGVNLAYQWYLSVTNQQKQLVELPRIIKKDFIMMREFYDIMIPIKYDYSFWKWIKDFLNVDCFLYWNRHDKYPYFYYFYHKILRFFKKL